jgi:hypothetical protein
VWEKVTKKDRRRLSLARETGTIDVQFRAARPETAPWKVTMTWELCTYFEACLQAKLERRIKMVEVKVLHEPRPGKKLLVVDIDYTIFDLGSSAEQPMELARCAPLA